MAALNAAFAAGDTITPSVLVERGLVRTPKKSAPVVKILGDGELTKKLNISGCVVSASAKTKIEAAGGSVA